LAVATWPADSQLKGGAAPWHNNGAAIPIKPT
jgi:hypothetical protein